MIEHLATAVLAWIALWMLLSTALALGRLLWRQRLPGRAMSPTTPPTMAPIAKPPAAGDLMAMDPRGASRLLLAWLLAPPLCSLALTALLYLPQLRLVALHCHGDSCGAHAPGTVWSLVPAVPLLAITAAAMLRFALQQWLPARRLLRQLLALGEAREGYMLLADDRPAAFTLGWLRPRVFLTAGLLAACDDSDRERILRHERAHLARRDNLRALLAQLATLCLPARWRQPLLADHALLCELACDAAAAHGATQGATHGATHGAIHGVTQDETPTGSEHVRRKPAHEQEQRSGENARLALAETLLRVHRLQPATPIGARGFSGDTERRVLALLAPPAPAVPLALRLGPPLVLLSCAALAIDPLHHALELFR